MEIPDALIEARCVDEAIAGSRTPSIIAVKVLRVKPSTSSGRLESTYTIRGDTRWLTIRGYLTSGIATFNPKESKSDPVRWLMPLLLLNLVE